MGWRTPWPQIVMSSLARALGAATSPIATAANRPMTIRDIGQDATGTGGRSCWGSMLEIQGPQTALIDEPLTLRARGGGEIAHWRCRMVDDDGRSWRARAWGAEELAGAWAPAKPGGRPVAALGSLRPVRLDVRVE